MSDSQGATSSGLAVFQSTDFALYQVVRFCVVAGLEMQSVAVGWQVYEITRSPLDLGLVGLAQFLPNILLFLLAGHTADRFSRKKVLFVCQAGFAVCSIGLIEISRRGLRDVRPIFAALVLLGIVRSFNAPAGRSLLPLLVPRELFPRAVAWNATTFQAATILGPAIGGLLYALFRGPSGVYVTSVAAFAVATASLLRVHLQSAQRMREDTSLRAVLAGLHYIWREKPILGSISLDLFAVLLGGAVALLPVYAREILRTGPWGLGILRSAPAVGAAAMAILIAHRPLKSRVGVTMLWCVGAFGAFTIIFGLSRSLIISLVALIFVGASDMVSVVIRATLVQIATPDAMRGRVN